MNFRYLLFVMILTLFSCNSSESGNKKNPPIVQKTKLNRVIAIQPLGDFPLKMAHEVQDSLTLICPDNVLFIAREFPKSAWYEKRQRYRADIMISEMRKWTLGDTVIIGLSTKDISHTKGKIHDYGIMGLGFCPGKACIVSTHRLNQKRLRNQFFKLALHELGHTQGLPHCPDKKCLMRDAEGKNHFEELNNYCFNCSDKLIKRGWKLN